MVGEGVFTWEDLRARLKAMPRGSALGLARRLEMNSSHFYRNLNHSRRPLDAVQARIVAEFLGAPTAGEAQAFQPPSRRRLAVYGYPADGEERIALGDGQVVETIELPMGLELGPGEYFAVRHYGSLMEPRIFPGEILVVRRGYPAAAGKDVLVEFGDGTGAVRTYRSQRQGRVFAEQFNPPATVSYDASSVRALHAVAFKL